MGMRPGEKFGGQHYDLLGFDYTEELPERGYFAAIINGEAKMCGFCEAHRNGTVQTEPYCLDHSDYTADAEVVGVLVAGITFFHFHEQEEEEQDEEQDQEQEQEQEQEEDEEEDEEATL